MSEMGSFLETPTAGEEAVAQSQVAKKGLDAWKQIQALQGKPPEYDLVKAVMLYVLTEGMAAPEAMNMAAWLADHGFNLPGMQDDAEGMGPSAPEAMPPDLMEMMGGKL